MKKFFFLIIGLQSVFCMGQKKCEYSVNVNDSIGNYKATSDYIISERTFGNTQATLFFSLINADGLPSLKVQLIQKSNAFIPSKCFDKNSKIILQLNDGKIVTLIGVDREICGESIGVDGIGSNRVLTGYFLFLQGMPELLKNSTVSILRIKYAVETTDYVLKEELKSEIDGKTYYPSAYFMNYLQCID